jgi:hypothetical protein
MAPTKSPASLSLHALCALLAALCVGTFAHGARANPPSLSEGWPVDTANPEHGAPTPEQMAKQPLQAGYFLMDVAALGDKALKDKRYADAVKFFGVLARLVPDRAVSFARLCESYQGLGDRENALKSCRDALGRDGATVADSARFVGLVLGGEGDLSVGDRADTEAVLTHLGEQHADAATLNRLECQLAAKIDDLGRLQACSSRLATLAPNDPRTTVFSWTLAARRGDGARANEWLARARVVGVEAPLLAEMEAQAKAVHPAWWTEHARAWLLFSSSALALLSLALFRWRARRATDKPVLGIVARM